MHATSMYSWGLQHISYLPVVSASWLHHDLPNPHFWSPLKLVRNSSISIHLCYALLRFHWILPEIIRSLRHASLDLCSKIAISQCWECEQHDSYTNWESFVNNIHCRSSNPSRKWFARNCLDVFFILLWSITFMIRNSNSYYDFCSINHQLSYRRHILLRLLPHHVTTYSLQIPSS